MRGGKHDRLFVHLLPPHDRDDGQRRRARAGARARRARPAAAVPERRALGQRPHPPQHRDAVRAEAARQGARRLLGGQHRRAHRLAAAGPHRRARRQPQRHAVDLRHDRRPRRAHVLRQAPEVARWSWRPSPASWAPTTGRTAASRRPARTAAAGGSRTATSSCWCPRRSGSEAGRPRSATATGPPRSPRDRRQRPSSPGCWPARDRSTRATRSTAAHRRVAACGSSCWSRPVEIPPETNPPARCS